MIVYRCSLLKWAQDLSGTGSYLHGGRWNTAGTKLIYTAENNVLAAFEVALRIPLDQISKNYVMVPISVPDDMDIYVPTLSKNWYKDQKLTRSIGDDFLRSDQSLMMKVPSALISDSYNYLINPAHPEIKKVKAQAPKSILFDKRLMDVMRTKSVE